MAFLSLCDGGKKSELLMAHSVDEKGEQHFHDPEYDNGKCCSVWQHGLGKVPANAPGCKCSMSVNGEWRALLKSVKGE